MKRKELFDFKKEINSIKLKAPKISLWRRFVNFILSLFRSNPRSSQAHEVAEETVGGMAVLPTENSYQEEDQAEDTKSIASSSGDYCDALSENQAEDTKSIASSSGDYCDALSENQEEDTKSISFSLDPSSDFSSDFKASFDTNTVKDLSLEEKSNDTVLSNKNNDESTQSLVLSIPRTEQLIHPTKDRPKLPTRRAPTRGRVQQRKVETVEADNNQEAVHVSSP